jgi:hypothetical protein
VTFFWQRKLSDFQIYEHTKLSFKILVIDNRINYLNYIKHIFSLLMLIGMSQYATAYGDGDDTLCPHGCLMKDSSNITEMRTYQAHSVIAVEINTEFQECPDGGYVDSASPNSAAMLSMLLSAFHANTQVRLQVYKSKEWPSSTGPTHCLIRAVRIYK